MVGIPIYETRLSHSDMVNIILDNNNEDIAFSYDLGNLLILCIVLNLISNSCLPRNLGRLKMTEKSVMGRM